MELAIEEERARQTTTEGRPALGDDLPKRFEVVPNQQAASETTREAKELERQNRDLEIASRAKDFYIERLEKEREKIVDQLVGMGRCVGELETQVFHLGGEPRGDRTLPQRSEGRNNVPDEVDRGTKLHYPQGGVAL